MHNSILKSMLARVVMETEKLQYYSIRIKYLAICIVGKHKHKHLPHCSRAVQNIVIFI